VTVVTMVTVGCLYLPQGEILSSQLALLLDFSCFRGVYEKTVTTVTMVTKQAKTAYLWESRR
jgi:hypothetical protein